MNDADLPDLWVRAADVGYETGNDVPAWLTRGFSPGATRYIPAARLDAKIVEVDRLMEDFANAYLTIQSLRAELEAARADAERYRWLKINARRIDFAGLCVSDGAQLDARIDAARKERT